MTARVSLSSLRLARKRQRISINSLFDGSDDEDVVDVKKPKYDLGTFLEEHAENTVPHACLSWRGDPEDTLSDWTINIQAETNHNNEDHTKIATYYVHKNVLGAGTWRSTYFEALFKNKALSEVKEMKECASTIVLHNLAAEAVEAMLDHVYFGKSQFGKNESPVALRYLAKYFGIRTLFEVANKSIKKDLVLHNYSAALRLLKHSSILNDDKVRAAAINILAANVNDLDDEYLKFFPPNIFRDLILKNVECGIPGMHSWESSLRSETIARYCRLKSGAIDGSFLASVMSAKVISSIAPEECLYFLNLCHTHSCDNNNDDNECLTELKKRVIKTCGKRWKKALFHSNEQSYVDSYSTLTDSTKVMLLEAALKDAKHKIYG